MKVLNLSFRKTACTRYCYWPEKKACWANIPGNSTDPCPSTHLARGSVTRVDVTNGYTRQNQPVTAHVRKHHNNEQCSANVPACHADHGNTDNQPDRLRGR